MERNNHTKPEEFTEAANLQLFMQPDLKELNDQFPGFEFGAALQQAGQFGGDFYDIRISPSGNLYLYLGDIPGKGLTAAFQAFGFDDVIHYIIDRIPANQLMDPAIILSNLNNHIVAITDHSEKRRSGLFLPIIFGRIDTDTNEFIYVNAGSPVLMKIGQDCTEIISGSSGMGLGFFSSVNFNSNLEQNETSDAVKFEPHQNSIKLEIGDLIILCSDGLTEAQDPNGNFLGTEGLQQIVRRYCDQNEISVQQLCDLVIEEVNSYEGGLPNEIDDRVIVAFRRKK